VTRPRVLIEIIPGAQGFPRSLIDTLARAVPEAEVVAAPRESLVAAIGTADGFVGNPTPGLVHRGTRLRWIQVHSGGVEDVLFPEIRDSPITLTNAKIVKGPQMADHAIGLLLALTRQLDRAIADRGQQKWSARGFAPLELRGKTAVIIGLGGAGTQIAERAFAFGMRVLAVDPKDLPLMRAVEQVVSPDRLPEVLPEADVLFISAPLTKATRGMLAEREFALMKPGVFVINVSRGEIIHTDALVRALAEGRVAGAGLDVVDPEPLPKGHRLWHMKHVVLTPHIAGGSDQNLARRRELVTENVRRFARGLPLRNVVDKAAGY
jgi:phosphoglycerate dehydrogenase-like enzyme